MTIDFSDRFLRIYPGLEPQTLDDLDVEEFRASYPELLKVVEAVRSTNLITSRRSAREIYLKMTCEADPAIAARLAAARDPAGVQLFDSVADVLRVLFGVDDPTVNTPTFAVPNIFVQGILRISIALTSARLIEQFSQLPEAAHHAQYKEQQAWKELDKLLEIPSLTNVSRPPAAEETERKVFYFQQSSFQLAVGEQLLLSIYLSGEWHDLSPYEGDISTATLVADIADTVNMLTIGSEHNIVASPVLADQRLHSIEVQARRREAVISTEVISLSIRHSSSSLLPFLWGVKRENLAGFHLNSVLLATKQGKSSVFPITSIDKVDELNVLYFRRSRRTGDIPTTSELHWRVSSVHDDIQVREIERLTDADPLKQAELDDCRAGQVGTALLNELHNQRETTKVLGAIIRNDPPGTIAPMCAIQLVAFTLTNLETWFVLDIIEVPEDIETAIGNIEKPITQFSSKPKSIKVIATYQLGGSGTLGPTDGDASLLFVRTPPSKLVRRFRDVSDYNPLHPTRQTRQLL